MTVVPDAKLPAAGLGRTGTEAEVLWRTALVDPEAAEQLAARLGVPVRVARWLLARDVQRPEDWLDPGAGWMEPWVFTDMSRAVQRVQEAVAKGERICIVGDYDVDGVTATAILSATLTALGAEFAAIIPHRVEDGYGLTESIVARAAEMGTRLLITVDNGIRAEAAVASALVCGMDVIVTDHHEPASPEVVRDESVWPCPVLHWARAADDEARALSGAGVAWKFASALLESAPGLPAPGDRQIGLLDWLTALAAIGTLADVMPLTGENRRLVKRGIHVLRSCRHPGWMEICRQAGVSAEWAGESELAWSIIPRLNAAGRMGTAEDALAVLHSVTEHEAQAAVERVEHWHTLRRCETQRATEEAIARCTASGADRSPGGIVIAGQWPLGVAGIVAAKLVERFGCAAVVLCDDGSDVLRGSGRAPAGVSVYEALAACVGEGVEFGGHEAAVGCHVQRSALEEFTARFAACTLARPAASSEPSWPLADDVLPLAELNDELVTWLERMGPFGPANPPLHFYVGPVVLERVVPMGDGSHLRLRVKEQGETADLLWFRAATEAFSWREGDVIAAVVTCERNVWQGQVRWQLRVVCAQRLTRALTREDFAYLYRLLRARRRLYRTELPTLWPQRPPEDVEVVFETFVELGFAEWTGSAYHVVETVVPRDLREARRYQAHLRRAGETS